MASHNLTTLRFSIGNAEYEAEIAVDGVKIARALARRAAAGKGRKASALGGGVTMSIKSIDRDGRVIAA